MSWRVLFATILLALGAAAWGGVQLGDWLVAHAPKASDVPGQTALASQDPILDANGRPYVAQPPQPRMDGSLGVPDKPTSAPWAVPTVSLFETTTDPSIKLSRENVTQEEARQLAATSSTLPSSDSSDISTLDLQSTLPTTTVPTNQEGYTVAAGTRMPGTSPQAANGAQSANWPDELRRELAQCANTGFFQRPTCSWNARNKYCGPNNAWGTISECPARQ